MRALSVRQPWANLIASGRKTVELRTWSTDYRGLLAISAGRTIDRDGAARLRVTEGELHPRGCVVCVVDLVDVRLVLPSDACAACAKRFSRTRSAVGVDHAARPSGRALHLAREAGCFRTSGCAPTLPLTTYSKE